MNQPGRHPILLYDGVCGLCHRFVQFILRRDRAEIFRFAALQSSLATGILQWHRLTLGSTHSVYVVVDYDAPQELLLSRSNAAIFVLSQLAGPWAKLGFVLRLFPKVLRDAGYDFVARNRYRIFGRQETCIPPPSEYRNRFLDTREPG